MVQADFESSVLGTKDHWDQVYEREISNFIEYGDVGEIWFGEESVEKMIDWIEDHIDNKEISVLDLGSGNGVFLLEMYERGYTNLMGVDYSKSAIDLANAICVFKEYNIKYLTCDILEPSQILELGTFDLVTDKGTLDAISLMPSSDNDEQMPDKNAISKYVSSVKFLLKDEGILLITSCNWTEEELLNIFSSDFTFHSRKPSPKFMFGGLSGQQTTTIAFQKQIKFE